MIALIIFAASTWAVLHVMTHTLVPALGRIAALMKGVL